MADRHSVQQAVMDRRSAAYFNEMNVTQRESIANEIQRMETNVDTFEPKDDQQLIFRKVVVGDAQLRTNDWPSKPRGTRTTFAGKWVVFQMICGGHATVHWVVEGETLTGLACLLTDVSGEAFVKTQQEQS